MKNSQIQPPFLRFYYSEKTFPKMSHKSLDIMGQSYNSMKFIGFCRMYCSHNVVGLGAKKVFKNNVYHSKASLMTLSKL